ncbi:glycosyltransferase [Anaerobacillus sp. CMMVII]|uniref:tetratricopeptide repeat-containing glycosyltransferase family 2 protein n=1 Tax=Anaerobacillus sp. CMMVII TaxID=2755588 RepID=UPI0021B7B4F0|nr:TPR domain-containing glycosyltransferase [Anaerobacillus sp. CMMVII]MCT8140152.1 glycosyltransferase [Anaerobacillus sp. CMMVII]
MEKFLSLCMIVKNEERTLDRCLSSVKDVVDEIIIVDTGSIDRTLEIANRYVQRVYEYEWNNSFSDARNFAQSKASGKWILVLDADEFVDTDNLKLAIDELKESKSSAEAFQVKIYNFTGKYGERIIQHKSIRLYRNSSSIKYYRLIHEQLKKVTGDLEVGSINLTLYHSGYLNSTMKEKNKSERNTHLLDNEIVLSGNSAFDYFNLGNEYLVTNETEKALEAFVNGYNKKISFNISWIPFCLVQIVNCLISLQRYEEALRVIADAENIFPASPDFKVFKANIYLSQHRYTDALEVLVSTIETHGDDNHCIVSIDYREYYPHLLLGKVYKKQNELSNAVFHFSKAYSFNKSKEALSELLNILYKNESESDIKHFIDTNIDISTTDDLINMVLILISIHDTVIVKEYIEKVNEPILVKGLNLRIALYENNIPTIKELMLVISNNELIELIKRQIIDFYDVIVIYFILGDGIITILRDLSYTLLGGDKSFIERLLSGSNLINETDKKHYLVLFERLLKYKFDSILNKFLEWRYSLGSDINIDIGDILYKYGCKDLAINSYKQVINTSFLSENSFANICKYYKDQQNFTQALKVASEALKLNKYDFRIITDFIEIFMSHQNYQGVIDTIDFGLENYKNSNYLKKKLELLFSILITNQEQSLALNLVNVLSKHFGEDAHSITMKSIVEMLTGNIDVAENILNNGLERFPRNYDILYNLHYLHEMQGRHNESDETLKLLNECLNTMRYLNPDISVQDFFKLLDEKGIKYVVLRWYDELLYSTAEIKDVDILVDDKDVYKLSKYFLPYYKEGAIPFDVYTPTPTPNNHFAGLPYYPRNLADQILRQREKLDIIYVPSNEDYMFSLIYHALYHKAENSGLDGKVSNNNKYYRKIKQFLTIINLIKKLR